MEGGSRQEQDEGRKADPRIEAGPGQCLLGTRGGGSSVVLLLLPVLPVGPAPVLGRGLAHPQGHDVSGVGVALLVLRFVVDDAVSADGEARGAEEVSDEGDRAAEARPFSGGFDDLGLDLVDGAHGGRELVGGEEPGAPVRVLAPGPERDERRLVRAFQGVDGVSESDPLFAGPPGDDAHTVRLRGGVERGDDEIGARGSDGRLTPQDEGDSPASLMEQLSPVEADEEVADSVAVRVAERGDRVARAEAVGAVEGHAQNESSSRFPGPNLR